MYDSFYGWYLKCQSDTQTLAMIPAVHQAGRKRTCSIQIINYNLGTVLLPRQAPIGIRNAVFFYWEGCVFELSGLTKSCTCTIWFTVL